MPGAGPGLDGTRGAAIGLGLALATAAMLALLGLWVSWWFLVAGLALHGGWDWLHHGVRGKETVPGCYVPFCAVYDWTLAVLVAAFFAGPPFG